MLNFGQISYEPFFCRPNGSQLKLSVKIGQLNFSYFAKIPPWLEVGGRKNQPHRVELSEVTDIKIFCKGKSETCKTLLLKKMEH